MTSSKWYRSLTKLHVVTSACLLSAGVICLAQENLLQNTSFEATMLVPL